MLALIGAKRAQKAGRRSRQTYRRFGMDRRQQSTVDFRKIAIGQFDPRRECQSIHVAVENGRISPFCLRDCTRADPKLDRQWLRLAGAMAALIAIADAIDFELESPWTATLDRDFDIKQAEDGIGLDAFLIEIDEGYPAVLAVTPARIRRHLRVAAARRPRRHRTEQAHLRKRPALNHLRGPLALTNCSLLPRDPVSSRRACGPGRRAHCRPERLRCPAHASRRHPAVSA